MNLGGWKYHVGVFTFVKMHYAGGTLEYWVPWYLLLPRMISSCCGTAKNEEFSVLTCGVYFPFFREFQPLCFNTLREGLRGEMLTFQKLPLEGSLRKVRE